MGETYFIQGADLSMREEGDIKTPTQMVSLFRSFDWASEHALQDRLEQAGDHNCPAGLSIVREPGVFLHLCLNLDGSVLTHCVHAVPTKFLGMFNSIKRTDLFSEKLDYDIAINAISKFILADEDWLLKHIGKEKSHEQTY